MKKFQVSWRERKLKDKNDMERYTKKKSKLFIKK